AGASSPPPAKVFGDLKRQERRISSVLPPMPKEWSPGRTAVRLSRMTSTWPFASSSHLPERAHVHHARSVGPCLWCSSHKFEATAVDACKRLRYDPANGSASEPMRGISHVQIDSVCRRCVFLYGAGDTRTTDFRNNQRSSQ